MKRATVESIGGGWNDVRANPLLFLEMERNPNSAVIHHQCCRGFEIRKHVLHCPLPCISQEGRRFHSTSIGARQLVEKSSFLPRAEATTVVLFSRRSVPGTPHDDPPQHNHTWISRKGDNPRKRPHSKQVPWRTAGRTRSWIHAFVS